MIAKEKAVVAPQAVGDSAGGEGAALVLAGVQAIEAEEEEGGEVSVGAWREAGWEGTEARTTIQAAAVAIGGEGAGDRSTKATVTEDTLGVGQSRKCCSRTRLTARESPSALGNAIERRRSARPQFSRRLEVLRGREGKEVVEILHCFAQFSTEPFWRWDRGFVGCSSDHSCSRWCNAPCRYVS